jgi:hypothetical protein
MFDEITEHGTVDLIVAMLRARGLCARRVGLHRTAAGAWIAVCSVDAVGSELAQDPILRTLVDAQHELGQLIAHAFAGAPISVSWEFQDAARASPANWESRATDALRVAAARLRATIAARKSESQRRSAGSAHAGTDNDPCPNPNADAGRTGDRVGRLPVRGSLWPQAKLDDCEFALVDYSQIVDVNGAD